MDDLHQWLLEAEKLGHLRTILDADWNKEIGAITEVAPRFDHRALLFDEIKSYPKGFRVLTNSMQSPQTLALALGLPIPKSNHELIKAVEDNLPLWEERMQNSDPKEVNDGHVMENIETGDDIDLLKFPAPFWHEHDGGRYLGTGTAIVLKDPDNGNLNIGTYRCMVHDRKTLGINLTYPHHGRLLFDRYVSQEKTCPVVASLGHHPIMLIGGASTVTSNVNEYNYAGGILGTPINVIRGRVTDLPFPANSEIVVEGEISLVETLDEGPFGEYLGYYAGGRKPRPVIKVKAIYYRNDPIILGAPPLKPPGGNVVWAGVVQSALVQSQLKKAGVPDAKVWIEPSGGRLLTIVSIKQRFPGHASQAGHIALTCGAAGNPSRYAIVVDDDIDPTNLNEVIWALCTRSDPIRSIDIIKKAVSNPVDPIIKKPADGFFTSRAVIDACKPFEWIKDFPRSVGVSEEVRKETTEKWFT